jgi:hypothetical protein
VQVEVCGGEVAEIDCEGAMARELVCGCAADADGGVCTCGGVSCDMLRGSCEVSVPVMMMTLPLTLLFDTVSS